MEIFEIEILWQPTRGIPGSNEVLFEIFKFEISKLDWIAEDEGTTGCKSLTYNEGISGLKKDDAVAVELQVYTVDDAAVVELQIDVEKDVVEYTCDPDVL